MIVVNYNNLLDGSEFYFSKTMFFSENAEIPEVTMKAKEILDKYNLNYVRFYFKGSNYLVTKEKITNKKTELQG